MKRFQFLMGFLCGALLLGGFTSATSAASNLVVPPGSQAIYMEGQPVQLEAYAMMMALRPMNKVALKAREYPHTKVGL